MAKQLVATTLKEDFERIGLSVGESSSEEASGEKEEKKEELNEDEAPSGDEEISEGDEDPIDGESVTKELFDRIEALPVDQMKSEDFEELLGELGKKKLPDGDEELREQAERVVVMLKEGAAKRHRRFKGGSTARKMSFQCPAGKRAVSTGGSGRPQCRPSHVVAGGMGNLRKEGRSKKKWGRGGKGQMSGRKSGRVEKRRKNLRSEGLMSPLAQELMQISEGIDTQETISVRDEIVERVVNILELLNEEFCDSSVCEIYEESISRMVDAYEAGRLEEDVIGEEEFIAELESQLSLITTTLKRLEDGEELGNE